MEIKTVGRIKKQKTVADMIDGETFYMVPWIAYMGCRHVVGFDMTIPVFDKGALETATLSITKHGEDDYIFDASHCEWRR